MSRCDWRLYFRRSLPSRNKHQPVPHIHLPKSSLRQEDCPWIQQWGLALLRDRKGSETCPSRAGRRGPESTPNHPVCGAPLLPTLPFPPPLLFCTRPPVFTTAISTSTC